MSRATIPDPQPSLQQRSARFAKLEHQSHRIVKELVAIIATIAFGALSTVFLLILGPFQEALHILGLTLRAPERRNRGDLFLRHKRRVHTLQTAGSRRQIKHVAAPQQTLRTV